MSKRISILRRAAALLRSERGATAVEYGLIISLVVLAIIGAMQSLATKTNGLWNNISNEVTKH